MFAVWHILGAHSTPLYTGEWVHNFEEGHFKDEYGPKNNTSQMTKKLLLFDKHVEYSITK